MNTEIIKEDIKNPIAALRDIISTQYYIWIKEGSDSKRQKFGYALISNIRRYIKLKTGSIPFELNEKIEIIEYYYRALDKNSRIYSRSLNRLIQLQDDVIGEFTSGLYGLNDIVDEIVRKEVVVATEGLRDGWSPMKESDAMMDKIKLGEEKRRLADATREHFKAD